MDAAHEKLKLLTAAEVCAGCELDADVTEWLQAKPDAATFLQQLTDAELHLDAVQFLCHALEPREAVWLAWDAATQLVGDDAAEERKAAVSATRAWLTTLEDKDRRAAYEASDACGLDNPAGCAAIAAFFAHGSLGSVELEQAIPAPAGGCAKAAAGAIVIAAVADPVNAQQRAAASVARWFALAATEPPWGDPAISAAGSIRVPEAKGDGSGGPDAAPSGDAPKPADAKAPAPKPDDSGTNDSGYDDSGYNTDMKF